MEHALVLMIEGQPLQNQMLETLVMPYLTFSLPSLQAKFKKTHVPTAVIFYYQQFKESTPPYFIFFCHGQRNFTENCECELDMRGW